MSDLFNYMFFQHAVLAAVLTSISCGIIGTYIVTRRIVFISGGITHTSFGGVGLGYFIGINPLIGAAVFSLISALGIEFLTKKADVRSDSAIAILWSFGMAVGILFIYLTPGYAPNLMSYLFGSILTVSRTELYLILAMSMFLILFVSVFYNLVVFISFDQEFSRSRKLPVDLLNYLMMALVSLTIVLSIKVAGIILIISLLTIPQTTANLFVNDYKKMIWYSIIIGIAGTLSGLALSYYLNIPSGATIICSLVIIFAIARLVHRIK